MHKEMCHAGINMCYYLDDMSQIVKDIITACDICQKRKTLTGKTKEVIHKLNANEPFEKIYVNIYGPLQTTVTQKKYVLAIIDQFSKYIILKAIKLQDDKTITKVLLFIL